jgi:D-3-phosphoglycerate dehydrogenase / 2-oxoglutarate reductase
MIQQMKRCRIISRFGIGVDNVDIPAATQARIVITKVPDYCIDEVSDHAVALLLALVRKIPFSNSQVHAGTWAMSAVVPIHRPDYVSIHSPLLPETRNLFNDDAFRQMKRTAYLVNTARGPIVDEVALARALDAGALAGAALDVMPQEPPVNSPLLGRANVIITPHTSFYSEESLVDLQVKAAEEVVRVLAGQAPRNPVNPEVLQRLDSRAQNSV